VLLTSPSLLGFPTRPLQRLLQLLVSALCSNWCTAVRVAMALLGPG
jgi:hypothetical protein